MPTPVSPRPAPAVTIKDIAHVLEMAHTTVSRALNDHPKINAETKERVRATAAKLGYVTNSGARTMRVGASRLVGMVVPDVRNEFYSEAAAAMATRCAELGYQLVLGVSDDDPQQEERQVRILRESRAAGVLLVPTGAPTATTIELLRHLPCVQFLRQDRAIQSVAVLADDMEGTFEATEHLIELGHRRIAYVGGVLAVSTGLRRHAGYEAALRKHGIARDKALQMLGPPRPEFACEAVQHLLRRSAPDVTGIVVAGSRQMLGVLQAVQALGLSVPQDLSVIAYGDADWFAVNTPPVSAVALPIGDMSAQAARLLFERLHHSDTGRARAKAPAFAARLVVRGTTAKPPRPRRR